MHTRLVGVAAVLDLLNRPLERLKLLQILKVCMLHYLLHLRIPQPQKLLVKLHCHRLEALFLRKDRVVRGLDLAANVVDLGDHGQISLRLILLCSIFRLFLQINQENLQNPRQADSYFQVISFPL